MTRLGAAGVALVLHLAWTASAAAQDWAPPADVRDDVAASLFERGASLYKEGHFSEACQLFHESVTTHPGGRRHQAARDLLERCKNEHGIVPGDLPPVPESPVDPYATADGGDEAPVDPYGAADDPWAEDTSGLVEDSVAAGAPAPRDALEAPSSSARLQLLVYSGAYGLYNGLAISKASNDDGDHIPAWMLGTGLVTVAGTYFLTRDRDITEGQAMAVMSGATWGTTELLLLTHVSESLDDSGDVDEKDYYGLSILGGALGVGGGVAYAILADPTPGEMSFTNSLGGYGAVAGLLLGGVMQPAEPGAYSLNAILGSATGLVLGAAMRVDASRKQMLYIDLGVAVGTVPALLGWASDAGGDTMQGLSLLSLVLAGGGAYLGYLLGEGTF